MTYIRFSTYLLSTNFSAKKAEEKIKELMEDSVLDSEEAFNTDYFVEEICSNLDEDEDGPFFTLLDSEDVSIQKKIDDEGCLEYSDEDIDTMVNDILYDTCEDEENDEMIDEDEEDLEEAEDFDGSFEDEEE